MYLYRRLGLKIKDVFSLSKGYVNSPAFGKHVSVFWTQDENPVEAVPVCPGVVHNAVVQMHFGVVQHERKVGPSLVRKQDGLTGNALLEKGVDGTQSTQICVALSRMTCDFHQET